MNNEWQNVGEIPIINIQSCKNYPHTNGQYHGEKKQHRKSKDIYGYRDFIDHHKNGHNCQGYKKINQSGGCTGNGNDYAREKDLGDQVNFACQADAGTLERL